MGNRRVNFHRFQRLVALLALRQILEGARIVQTVRQLDENDADILRHGEEHLAQVLKLLLLLGVAQHAQTGDAVDQLGNRRTEFIFDFLVAEVGVLDTVMQQRRANRVGIQPHFHHDFRNRNRMDDIWLTVFAFLSLMRSSRALISRTDFSNIRLRVLLLHALD